MKDVIFNKYTILLILFIIGVAFIGGLEQKKTAEMDASDGQQSIVYLKK